MLTAQRRRTIFVLALPIIGGMLSQNVLNLVDTAMVGALDDPNPALAAAGIGGFANFMASAMIMGLGAGVQALSARRFGEKQFDEMAKPLNGGIFLALLLAIPWSITLFQFIPDLFPLIEDDPSVVALGVPYLEWRVVGMSALALNFAFRGYWNGVNLSKLYMGTLVVMHACNILLNWILIFGNLGAPALGVEGAAIATTTAIYMGTGMYFFLAFKHARSAGFMKHLPSKETLRSMLKLSIPAGLQNFFFATGMVVLFTMIAQIGTKEVAAANVLINLMLVAVLPGMAFGMAAASLVGQSLGRKEPDEAEAWGIDVGKLAVLCISLLALPALFVPDLLLGVFLHDKETLELARLPLQITAMMIFFDTMGLVLLNALLGAGASRTVMFVATGMQWGIGLPLIYLVGPVMGWGLVGVWAIQGGYRSAQALVFFRVWRRGAWKTIKL